ncbi:MAG: hypothetical protein ACOVSR_14315 [Bacteroidia bacterium]
MSTPTKLEWHVERIAWRDMIPYEHNPRKMSVKTKQKLRVSESYEKFGDVEILVLDFDNMIITGHQRHSVKIATGFGDELSEVNQVNLAEFRNIDAEKKDFEYLQRVFGKEIVTLRKSPGKGHEYQKSLKLPF